MSNEDIKNLNDLFSIYDQKEAELQAAKAAIEAAQQTRSAAIQAIVDASGGKKKFNRNGKLLTVVKRGETLFFRGAGVDEEVISL